MAFESLRLGIFSDNFSEDTFICKNSSGVFARVNRIGETWCVWYYTHHIQRNYRTLRDAVRDINSRFLDHYYR